MAIDTVSSSPPPTDEGIDAGPNAADGSLSPNVRWPRKHGGTPPWLTRWVAPVSVGVALLVLWEGLTHVVRVPAFVLPGPESVALTLWALLTNGDLLHYTGWTLAESLAGFALGTIVALPAGYAVARSRWTAQAIQPYLAASQALPAVALAPLLIVWLGAGLSSTTVLCALIVFFPTYITTTLGIRALDHEVIDAARVDGASGWTLLWHVEWPLALPAVLAGLRTSLTLSITGSVVGDFVVGGNGLGSLLALEAGQLDTKSIFALLFVLGLLAALLYGLARLAERRFSYQEAR
jgi:NitT/TauT family transport system permease protein